MEFQLIIKGSFSEIQEALFALTDGAHVDAVLEHTSSELSDKDTDAIREIMKQVLHVSHPQDYRTPDTEPGEPIRQAKPKPYKTRTTTKSTGPRESVSEDVQIHCHQCGHLFHPRTTRSKHCSEKCYQREWYELHKKPADPQLPPPPPPPPLPAPPEDREYGPGGVPIKKTRMNDEHREAVGKFKKAPGKPVPSDNFGGLY